LLAHVHDEVIPAFRLCAAGTATLMVPHPDQRPGLETVCESAARFDRALSVAALAAEAGQVSPPFRSAVITAADALTDWGTELCTLTTALGRLLDDPTGP
jgi:hypothetical protein